VLVDGWAAVLRFSKDEGWPLARPCLLPSFETRASFDKLRSALLRMRAVIFPHAFEAFSA
jgi:hypothetical protein